MAKKKPTESNADILRERGPRAYTIEREKRRQEQRAKAVGEPRYRAIRHTNNAGIERRDGHERSTAAAGRE